MAEAAGYSRGIVTYQFGGKAGLLRAVALHSQSQVGAVPPNVRGAAWVVALVDRYFASSLANQDATRAFLILWSEATAGEKPLQEIFVERDKWFRSQIVEAVRDGMESGTIRTDIDPDAYAYSLVGQLRGVVMQLMLSGEERLGAVGLECSTMVGRHLATVDSS